MPCPKAPAKVLITGVNGYVGSHVAKNLLERGNTGLRKGVKRLLSAFTCTDSAILRDNQPKVFDEIIGVGGFDGVAHTAAPIPSSFGLSPSSALKGSFDAVVEGVVNILGSIKAHGRTVKRVLFASSGLAASQFKPGIKHNEAHWNDKSLNIFEEKGDMALDFERHVASKFLSEKAAWKFVEDNVGKINFDLVAILPTIIIGMPVNENTPLDQLGSSHFLFEALRSPRTDAQLTDAPLSLVYVKYVAAVHSEAFIQPSAAGHRVIVAGAEPSWQDMYNALNEQPAFLGVTKGNPGLEKRPDNESEEWDASFAQLLLGRKLIGVKDMIRETAKYYQGAGWKFSQA
ncbi:unnamed protein product [Rhizoctonia solani]|uniref:NAD-dependent epimerase/dehydratase domain-containing protein n=1 Tax=Rhizoctonia solani TaxID=456999 RepID=A0A8H2WDE3_9AGAM|nr:unnamed protein product [Rhizoctonia solani]